MAWFVRRLWFANDKTTAVVVAALFAIGTPYRVCLGNGQHAMFSMAFFAATLWAMENRKPWWIVGLLMAASLFKYTFAVPLAFFFLYKRQWKAIAMCVAVHVALTIALGIWTNTNPILLVVQSMKVGAALNTAGGDADWAGFANGLGVLNVKPVAFAGYVLYGILLFVYSFTGRRDALLKLATLAVIANVMFYHRIYDFVTLIFPLIYVVKQWDSRAGLDRVIRWLVVANVAWAFYLQRIFEASSQVPSAFVFCPLQHVLLVALLWKSYGRGAVECKQ